MIETSEKLLHEADRSAELLIGCVRLAIAACLGALVFSTIHRSEIDPTATYAVILAYAALGLVSVLVSRSRFFSSATPFFLIVVEGVIVATGLYIGLATSDAAPAWLMATPAAIWAIIALTLQSLRFRIELQAFASLIILGAFLIVGLSSSPNPAPDGAAFLVAAFDPLTNQIRFVLLMLLALALSVSVWRSRRMLHRIMAETEASLNLARFLPKEIRAQASAEGLDDLREGRAIKAVIIFIDIRGFTRMSDAVGSRAISEFLTRYRGVITRIVARHGGVVDKFIGDGALIFFGNSDDPQTAAAKAIAATKDLSASLMDQITLPQSATPGQPPYVVVAHFGDVLVGAFGEDDRLEFTIIGSPVNETARLEAIAKEKDAAIVVSAATFLAAEQSIDPAEWLDLGDIHLRGAGKPQRVYQRRKPEASQKANP